MPDNEDEPTPRADARDRRSGRASATSWRRGGGARERSAPLPTMTTALSPLCDEIDIWRTTYVHRLDGPDAIVTWVEGAGLRPFLAPLTPKSARTFSRATARRRRGLSAARRAAASCCRSRVCSSWRRARATGIDGSLCAAASTVAASRWRIEEPAMRRTCRFAVLAAAPARCRRRVGAGQRHARSRAVAAARQSRRSETPGQGSLRPRDDPSRGADALDRLLRARLSGRRRSAAGRRRDLAGDAPFAQSLLGPSRRRSPSSSAFRARRRDEGVWPGILVGDISQPRGGPMLTGHASHQIGLDADIWLTPMPDHTLSRASARRCRRSTWSGRTASRSIPRIGRRAGGRHQGRGRGAGGRTHLRQRRDQESAVRDRRGRAVDEQGAPLWGHNYHFHVRIVCPAGDTACQPQDPVPPGDGCDKSLDWWFTEEALHPRAEPSPRRR